MDADEKKEMIPEAEGSASPDERPEEGEALDGKAAEAAGDPAEDGEGGNGAPGKGRKEERSAKKECAALRRECDAYKKEIAKLKKELEEQKENAQAQNERYLRMMAEYDNFRRRSAQEKDGIYADACTDVLTEILPVVDALELAIRYGGDGEKVMQGIQMTLNKFNEVLAKLGVTPVETATFDPNLHNAVMHVEDDEHGEGEILEVFQKGYKKGDKVIRYAMVKVAN